MKITVNKEGIFNSYGSTMAISSTESGYTLASSVDGENWSQYKDVIPAGENCVVTDLVVGMYFKLIGNTSDGVIIKF